MYPKPILNWTNVPDKTGRTLSSIDTRKGRHNRLRPGCTLRDMSVGLSFRSFGQTLTSCRCPLPPHRPLSCTSVVFYRRHSGMRQLQDSKYL